MAEPKIDQFPHTAIAAELARVGEAIQDMRREIDKLMDGCRVTLAGAQAMQRDRARDYRKHEVAG